MTPQQTAFINLCAPAADASEKSTGIRREITLAQAILESGWGKTLLATECNNLFGIKANQHQIANHQYHEFITHEQLNSGKIETIKADFAVYESLEDCFSAHAALLSTPHYAAAMAVCSDADQFAYMLGPKTKQHPTACGYSTLVDYHDRLMRLIRLYNLNSSTWLATGK